MLVDGLSMVCEGQRSWARLPEFGPAIEEENLVFIEAEAARRHVWSRDEMLVFGPVRL